MSDTDNQTPAPVVVDPQPVKAEAPKTRKPKATAPIDTLEEFAGDPPVTLSGAVQVNF